jgi:hypothetical protein
MQFVVFQWASWGFRVYGLMKAIVACLLLEQMYGGWEGGVLWYDLDGHFDMLHLMCLLQARIQQGMDISLGKAWVHGFLQFITWFY